MSLGCLSQGSFVKESLGDTIASSIFEGLLCLRSGEKKCFTNHLDIVCSSMVQISVVKSPVLPPTCRAPSCLETPWALWCLRDCPIPPPPATVWSHRAQGGGLNLTKCAMSVPNPHLTQRLFLPLQVFFQVRPPGPSHEETPLSGSRGESCGLRGVKVEEPWAEGCVFQPKHAILHPTQLPPGPLFLEGLLRANKSCKKRHSNRGAWCLGFPGLIHWYLTFWAAPKPFAVSMCTENVNDWATVCYEDLLMTVCWGTFFFLWLFYNCKRKKIVWMSCMWGISREMGRPPIISKGWGEGCLHLFQGKTERGRGE